MGVGLLPLSVASVVFAIVNDRLNQQLRERALRDDLTGTLSRRGLREHGERMLAGQPLAHPPAHPLAQGGGIAALMLDVDHFKAINDDYGHLTGDFVLRELAMLLAQRVRREELLARYGGEEFVLVLPETQLDGARAYAEALRKMVEAHDFCFEDQHIQVTVSIGVAAFDPDMVRPTDLVGAADERLYEAKRAGRNRIAP